MRRSLSADGEPAACVAQRVPTSLQQADQVRLPLYIIHLIKLHDPHRVRISVATLRSLSTASTDDVKLEHAIGVKARPLMLRSVRRVIESKRLESCLS
jgi:hypothetical protein